MCPATAEAGRRPEPDRPPTGTEGSQPQIARRRGSHLRLVESGPDASRSEQDKPPDGTGRRTRRWIVLVAAAIVTAGAGLLAWQNIADDAAPTPETGGSEPDIRADSNDGLLSDSEVQVARVSYQEIVDNDAPFWIGMRGAVDFSDPEIRSLGQVACEQAIAADSALAYLAGVQAAVGEDPSRATMAGAAGVAACQTDLQPHLDRLDALERFVDPRL